jgi:hypothetical protein
MISLLTLLQAAGWLVGFYGLCEILRDMVKRVLMENAGEHGPQVRRLR